MKKPGISQTRQNILAFIHDFFDDRGYAPTVRDILKGCHLSSTAVVQHHLNVLEKEGHIHRDPEVFRSIQLLDKKNIIQIPLLGTIAAGKPIPVPTNGSWQAEATEIIELTDDFTKGKPVFALKVKGLSMIDALIDDGDIVIIESTKTADNGDMVVAWIKDREEVTLKKIYKMGDKIRLEPANNQMKPIIVDSNNVDVQGKVISVIRRL